MSVLVIADIVSNELSIDLTGKTVNAVTHLGEVTILCASDDAKNASIEASKINGVNINSPPAGEGTPSKKLFFHSS